MKVGNYDIVRSYSVICTGTDTTEIPLEIPGLTLTVRIRFDYSKNSETKRDASLTINDAGNNIADLTFINWENSLGTATKVPVQLAITDNGKGELAFMAAHWLIGQSSNKFDIQFMTRKL